MFPQTMQSATSSASGASPCSRLERCTSLILEPHDLQRPEDRQITLPSAGAPHLRQTLAAGSPLRHALQSGWGALPRV
jgi:hypothetical protein